MRFALMFHGMVDLKCVDISRKTALHYTEIPIGVRFGALYHIFMNTREARCYTVAVSRLMVGGRLFSKGDIVSSNSLTGLSNVVRSGALVPLPLGLEATASSGLPLDIEEPGRQVTEESAWTATAD